MNLLEAYKNRISYASKYANDKGTPMSQQKKVLLAKLLNNTDRFLTEAFAGTNATQLSNMTMTDGTSYKKFCLNLTTMAVPSLILPELMMVQPMSSMSGYLVYVKYVIGTGSLKDATEGNVFQDPWTLGDIDQEVRTSYTSSSVVEVFKGDGTATTFTLGFSQANALASVTVAGTAVQGSTLANGVVTLAAAPAANAEVRIAYTYDNVTIPQEVVPVYNAKMDSISLNAKARRIAIRYSQIAAFQAKTDYGFDMQQQLAAQAVGELAYEIDTEGVALLDKAAGDASPDLYWNIRRPDYISKADHYEGFAEVLEAAKAIMFDRTKKFAPNYMVANSKVLRVLPFIKGWQPANIATMNGPFLAGTLNGIKVFISPALAEGRFFLGVNQGDVYTSAAVYAPYMMITPTQLLGFADGSMTQGFSTLYDMKILNEILLVAGQITDEASFPGTAVPSGDVAIY